MFPRTSCSSFRMDLLDRSHPPPRTRHRSSRCFIEEQDERVDLDETSRSTLDEINSSQRPPRLSHSHPASITSSNYRESSYSINSSASRDERGLVCHEPLILFLVLPVHSSLSPGSTLSLSSFSIFLLCGSGPRNLSINISKGEVFRSPRVARQQEAHFFKRGC